MINWDGKDIPMKLKSDLSTFRYETEIIHNTEQTNIVEIQLVFKLLDAKYK